MYRLKEDVKIILKRDSAIVTRESLAKNQNLATLILEDPFYSQRYGHLIEEVGTNGKAKKPNVQPKTIGHDPFTIEVNVKKKPVEQSTESQPTASQLTEIPTGGEDLKPSEQKPVSKSTGSGLLKQVKQDTGSKKKKSDVSEATKK